MAWTNLSFPFGSVLTSSKMTQLDDNFEALANGDSGAPAVQNAALANHPWGQSDIDSNAVGRSEAKTSTASTSGSVAQTGTANITLNPYAFFPMIHVDDPSDNTFLAGHSNDGASPDNPRFRFVNQGSSPRNYDVDHRYIAP